MKKLTPGILLGLFGENIGSADEVAAALKNEIQATTAVKRLEAGSELCLALIPIATSYDALPESSGFTTMSEEQHASQFTALAEKQAWNGEKIKGFLTLFMQYAPTIISLIGGFTKQQ